MLKILIPPLGADFTRKFRFRKSQNFTPILTLFHNSFIFRSEYFRIIRLQMMYMRQPIICPCGRAERLKFSIYCSWCPFG